MWLAAPSVGVTLLSLAQCCCGWSCVNGAYTALFYLNRAVADAVQLASVALLTKPALLSYCRSICSTELEFAKHKLFANCLPPSLMAVSKKSELHSRLHHESSCTIGVTSSSCTIWAVAALFEFHYQSWCHPIWAAVHYPTWCRTSCRRPIHLSFLSPQRIFMDICCWRWRKLKRITILWLIICEAIF